MNLKRLNAILLSLIFATAAIAGSFQAIYASPQTPITRSQVEQRALDMINLTWTFDSSKNTNISSNWTSAVKLATQFQGITSSAQQTGIPYAWGGLDSLDTYSYNAPWTSFPDAINKGAYAGNLQTGLGYGYIPGTAGLDCSGFVQAGFNIRDYKQSTQTLLQNYFTQINMSNIKHMDILNNMTDHVAIFDKWGYQNGIYGAFTFESTTNQTYGGIQGTKRYFLSMDYLTRKGYIAAKFNYLIEDSTQTPPPTSTSTLPFPVKAGVYAQVSNVSDWANIRSDASLNAPVIGTVPKGTILYMKAYNSGWYQIGYNGQIGWVWGSLIASIPSGKYVVTISSVTNYLNIRSTPSSTASIIGAIKPNDIATVIGYSNDGQWYLVQNNGVQGWASKQYLSYLY